MLEGMPVASGPGGVSAVQIANGANTSNAIDLGNKRLARLDFPAAFDGTTVTFLVSADNVTFVPLYKDDGTQYTVTMAQGHGVAVDLATLASARYLQIVAGSNQGAARIVTLSTLA